MVCSTEGVCVLMVCATEGVSALKKQEFKHVRVLNTIREIFKIYLDTHAMLLYATRRRSIPTAPSFFKI